MKFMLLFCWLLVSCSNFAPKKNSQDSWIQLFNGRDLDDWKVKITGYPLQDNFANTFRVENGLLKVNYDGYSEFGNRFGHLFYKQKFSYYLLGIEYRFVNNQVTGGPSWAIRNSGAMLHSQDPATMLLIQDFPISIEVQLLGGNGKDKRTTANLCTPGTNVVLKGKLFTDHCISSGSETFHGDQWVRVEVLVLGDSVVKHFINKKSILEYEKPQVGNGNVSNYDPAAKKDGMLLSEGYIALQSESHPVEFRKVELFNLQDYRNKGTLPQVLQQLGLQ